MCKCIIINFHFQYFSRMVAIAITAIVALPWLLIPCVVLLPIFLAIRWYYLLTVRDLKRLEGLGESVHQTYHYVHRMMSVYISCIENYLS